MHEGRILLVEDDDDIREALMEVLESEGFEVNAAANGQEGLAALERGPLPEVVLLDLMMPVKDGAQFSAEQKREPKWAQIPVVLMSAHNNAQEKAQQMGAVAFLKKPVDIETVLNTVRRFCHGN